MGLVTSPCPSRDSGSFISSSMQRMGRHPSKVEGLKIPGAQSSAGLGERGPSIPFFCFDDPINLLTVPVPFFPTEAGHPPCASRASISTNPPGPGLLLRLTTSFWTPRSPHHITSSQKCLWLASWGFWHKVLGTPARGTGPDPSQGLALCLPTRFLRGFFVDALVSLYLGSVFSLPFIPVTECLEYIYFYLFFANLKSLASHNRLPGL